MSEPGTYDTNTDDMLAVHHAITQALTSAPRLVGGASDAGNEAAVASFYQNVIEFLHVHHAGEDELIYPVLESRCVKDDDLLERIDSQHQLLHEPMDAARAAIVAWESAPTPQSAQAAVTAILAIESTLTPHLREEEANVLPLAKKWLSQEEWGQLPPHALQTFSLDKPWLALGMVYDHLPSDAERNMMIGSMPPPLQQMWTEQWQPAYRLFLAEVGF
jgi:hemerythrin-like domain-containing protein